MYVWQVAGLVLRAALLFSWVRRSPSTRTLTHLLGWSLSWASPIPLTTGILPKEDTLQALDIVLRDERRRGSQLIVGRTRLTGGG
ncbi:hypothetical protein B0H17DRAFT_1091134, partial [Mycena rosella]